MPRSVRMCIVTAQASTVQVLYRGQLEYLSRNGFEITVVCAPSEETAGFDGRGLRYQPLAIRREIAPFSDLMAIRRLTTFLKAERFDLVQACTPKGSLIGTMAASRARVPLIVHLLRGLAYHRRHGPKRWLLKAAARVPCVRAHHTIAVGHELRKAAVDDGLVGPDRITVLHKGSSNGVDLERFNPARLGEREAARQSYGLPADAVVIGFAGRLTRDKGVAELVEAFGQVRARLEPAGIPVWLLIVGSPEKSNPPPQSVVQAIHADPRVVHVEWHTDIVPFYAAVDVVALPTYREGFNNVILEAAAMQRPMVASDVIGCREAVVEMETGLLAPPADPAGLAAALERLARDPRLRGRMGEAARRRVEADFDCRRIWPLYVQEYRRLFEQHCPALLTELAIGGG